MLKKWEKNYIWTKGKNITSQLWEHSLSLGKKKKSMISYLWYIFQNLNHIINCSITYWSPACAFLKVAQQLWSASKHKLNMNSLGKCIRGAVSVKNQQLIPSPPLWNPIHILLEQVNSLKLMALLTAATPSILLVYWNGSYKPNVLYTFKLKMS